MAEKQTVGYKADEKERKRIEKGVTALREKTGVHSLNESDFFRAAVDKLLTELKVK